MREASERRPRISFQAIADLAQLADYTIPFVLRTVCKLGVADHLKAGPRSVEELARACGAHAPSLLRAMRALVSRGVFVEPQPGSFDLNVLADSLRSDHPFSMRYAFRLAPDVEAFAALEHSVRTGEPSFEHIFGQDYFSYLATHPDLLAEFQASQRALSRVEEVVFLRSYDWTSAKTVVDIGGGDGTFLARLLATYPEMHGVLVDLPDTVLAAPEVFALAGVADRCQVVGAPFRETRFPVGADVYLIKRVLVGLEDRDVVSLLRSVRSVMRQHSRMLILQPMRVDGDLSVPMDILMLVLGKGCVRTPAELESLLEAAGMKTTRGVTTAMFPFIEAGPIPAPSHLARRSDAPSGASRL